MRRGRLAAVEIGSRAKAATWAGAERSGKEGCWRTCEGTCLAPWRCTVQASVQVFPSARLRPFLTICATVLPQDCLCLRETSRVSRGAPAPGAGARWPVWPTGRRGTLRLGCPTTTISAKTGYYPPHHLTCFHNVYKDPLCQPDFPSDFPYQMQIWTLSAKFHAMCQDL